MSNIGIFGGAFNPIHNGHIYLAEEISNLLDLDKVLIIPASIPPHKAWLQMTDSKHRYEMCCLACEDNPLFYVSDMEINREGSSYTIDTLNEISAIYKDSNLYMILGADSFLSVIKWFKFAEIIKLAALCTAPRSIDDYNILLETDKLLKAAGAETRIFNIPIMPISSTFIRKNLLYGNSVEGMIPVKVSEYIKRNNLYKQNWSDI